MMAFMAWLGLAWFGLVWFGWLGLFGLVWFGFISALGSSGIIIDYSKMQEILETTEDYLSPG